MNFNFFIRKEQSEELKDLKEKLDLNKKNKIIDKLLQSKEIDKLIFKVQEIYHKISEKLFIKYDLKNDLKQGKIFTILIAVLIFLYLIVTTIFFVIMLNSLIGLNLIFSLIKYSLFFIKWGYTIIKSKGSVIQKYLANLFPNSKVFKNNQNQKDGLSIYETLILKEVENFIEKISMMNLDIETEKDMVLKLKEVVELLQVEDSFQEEFRSLSDKQQISMLLEEVRSTLEFIDKKSYQQQTLLTIKEEIQERLDNQLEEKINQEEPSLKIKKLSK